MQSAFEWDPAKDAANQRRHGVRFFEAQLAFLDSHRVIAEALGHGRTERFLLLRPGFSRSIDSSIHFSWGIIRILGAGYWRRGRRAYEAQAKIYQ